MQGIATFSLMFSLGLAYVINPIDDSLFFKALDGIISGIYGKEVLDELNNSAVAGMLVGLFAGTLFVFLSMNKKVYNYSILFLFTFSSLVFLADIMNYDFFPYQVTQQLFLWFWIGLPIFVGIIGIWQDYIGNQIVAAFSFGYAFRFVRKY